jgi:mRNA interferase RelE/StbE
VASYRVGIKPSAVKELEALPPKDRRRVASRIQLLAGNPRPKGYEKLSGQELYRIRQGSYRILYTVEDAEPIIIVIRVGHRREVYR